VFYKWSSSQIPAETNLEIKLKSQNRKHENNKEREQKKNIGGRKLAAAQPSQPNPVGSLALGPAYPFDRLQPSDRPKLLAVDQAPGRPRQDPRRRPWWL
jgi:hypothetical protein